MEKLYFMPLLSNLVEFCYEWGLKHASNTHRKIFETVYKKFASTSEYLIATVMDEFHERFREFKEKYEKIP